MTGPTIRLPDRARRSPGVLTVIAAGALLVGCSLAGCSGSSGTPTAGATTAASTAATAATAGGSATSSLVPTQPTGSASGNAPTSPSPTGLPGEPYDRGPAKGAVLAVAGVQAGNTLALRAAPGIDQQTVAAMPSLTRGLVATGRARTVTGTVWVELRFGALSGWSAARYLVWLADSTDVTAQAVKALGARTAAETMLDLGKAVAGAGLPGVGTGTVLVTGGPTVGDLGEITVDVATSGDDAVAGHRLRVLASPSASGEGFVLKSVELTPLCTRGVSGGKCT